MQLAVFVDPTPDEYSSAIETATFVAEVASRLGESMVLSCSPQAALEIGLALLGEARARTVEGGERRPSPIILAPMIRTPAGSESLRPEGDRDVSGTLADLVDLGVIASREESDVDSFGDDNPIEAFVHILRRRRISVVLGLGSRSEFWEPTLNFLRTNPDGRMLRPTAFSPRDFHSGDVRIVLIQPAEISLRGVVTSPESTRAVEDEFDQHILEARREAAIVAGLIESIFANSR